MAVLGGCNVIDVVMIEPLDYVAYPVRSVYLLLIWFMMVLYAYMMSMYDDAHR